MKDSSTGNIESILFAVRNHFDVMAGSINNFFMGMITGASGGVLSLADSFPDITVELYRLLASKHYDKAVALNDRILQINKIVSGKGGVAAVKYAMDLNGLVGGYPRLPHAAPCGGGQGGDPGKTGGGGTALTLVGRRSTTIKIGGICYGKV